MEGYSRIVPKDVKEATELMIKDNIMLDIKPLSVEDKANIIKKAIEYNELSDPLMIMNLVNLVKVYNTLEDSYFTSPDVYVNSVEELLDLKLALSKELKEFTRQISIYFLSLFKSYSKAVYMSTDEHMSLPNLYSTIFCATDFLTLSGIFAKTPKISTDELIYIDNASSILLQLIMKSANTLAMMNSFFEAKEEQE